MVQLDYQLLYCARQLFDGANVHHLKELIFAYEQAVDLHNRQLPSHEIYRIRSEVRLRNYVHECQGKEIRRQTDAAIRHAADAQTRFDLIE